MLEISDYFDSLRSELDLKTELFIDKHINNDTLVSTANATRQVCLGKIHECEKKSNDGELFPQFCFLVNFHHHDEHEIKEWSHTQPSLNIHLIVTDRHLTRAQIDLYQTILKFTPGYKRQWQTKIATATSLDKIFTNASLKNGSVMKIENNQVNLCIDSIIVEAPSDHLFNFNSLSVDFLFESINSDANFLFRNVQKLTIKQLSACEKKLKNCFNSFGKTLDSISLDFEFIEPGTIPAIAELAVEYPIRAFTSYQLSEWCFVEAATMNQIYEHQLDGLTELL
jgi:hypothetical protein